MFKKSGCSQERSLEQDFLSTLEPETSIVSNGCFNGMTNQIFTWGNWCFTISIHFKTGSLGVCRARLHWLFCRDFLWCYLYWFLLGMRFFFPVPFLAKSWKWTKIPLRERKLILDRSIFHFHGGGRKSMILLNRCELSWTIMIILVVTFILAMGALHPQMIPWILCCFKSLNPHVFDCGYRTNHLGQ